MYTQKFLSALEEPSFLFAFFVNCSSQTDSKNRMGHFDWLDKNIARLVRSKTGFSFVGFYSYKSILKTNAWHNKKG
jgi:hypothetical protein